MASPVADRRQCGEAGVGAEPSGRRHHGNRHGRSEQARQAVLEAADDLLVEKGFAGVTIEGIAARAGVAKQTIYRWWKTKTDVLLDAFLQDVAEDLTPPDHGDVARDLRAHLRQLAQFLSRLRRRRRLQGPDRARPSTIPRSPHDSPGRIPRRATPPRPPATGTRRTQGPTTRRPRPDGRDGPARGPPLLPRTGDRGADRPRVHGQPRRHVPPPTRPDDPGDLLTEPGRPPGDHRLRTRGLDLPQHDQGPGIRIHTG